jgi:hypothetical protein
MQEETKQVSLGDRVLSTAMIWRLAQVVLVLAAALLFLRVASFGNQLQQARLFFNPHTGLLIQAALVGIGLGVCVGLAIKDFTSGRIEFHVDWPTLLINLVAAGVFVALSIAVDISSVQNGVIDASAAKSAVLLDPLLPFAWVGLTLTSLLRAKA